MTEPNTCRAYFTLVGEFDPMEISARVGMKPTRSWKKGDINPSTQRERNHSRWCLDSRLDQTAPLESHVADVLEQLRPHATSVEQVRSAVDGGMQLVAYFYSHYPGFSLEASVLSELGALKLGIDCDFYFLYSDKREDSE
jgi:hypothetical protein